MTAEGPVLPTHAAQGAAALSPGIASISCLLFFQNSGSDPSIWLKLGEGVTLVWLPLRLGENQKPTLISRGRGSVTQPVAGPVVRTVFITVVNPGRLAYSRHSVLPVITHHLNPQSIEKGQLPSRSLHKSLDTRPAAR